MLSVCSSDCLILENVIFKDLEKILHRETIELIETLGSKAYNSEMCWRKTEVVVPVRAEL